MAANIVVAFVGLFILLTIADGQGPTSSCSAGEVRCADGRCLPQSLSNLCQLPALTVPSSTAVMVSMDTPENTGSTMSMTAQILMSGSTNTVLNTIQNTAQTAAVTTAAIKCHIGYVQCNDGRCESYPSLCGDTGYVTLTPLVTVPTAAVVSGSSSVVTDVPMVTTTLPTITTTTTPMAIITDSTGQEVCPSGWEKCKDGVCEPFHWLCTEHDGSVDPDQTAPEEAVWPGSALFAHGVCFSITRTVITSPAPLTTAAPPITSTSAASQSSLAATTGNVTTAGTMVSGATVTSSVMPSGNVTTAGTMVSGATLTSSVTPSGTEVCQAGWERCADGTCEPFHWLCSEHSGSNITLPTAGTLPPTTTPGTGPTVTNTVAVSTPTSTASVMTTTTQAATTTTTAGTTVVVPTDSSGACPEGWEKCSDGACEPYHYLCEDHAIAVIG